MTKQDDLPIYLRRILKENGFAALYVAGPRQVVPKRMGDNRGCRPLKIGIQTSWIDEVTRKLNGASYTVWQGVLFRVWCRDAVAAKQLERLVRANFKETADPLRLAWFDLGPELDLLSLQRAIRIMASDNGLTTWSDEELVWELQMIGSRRVQRIKRGAYA